MRLSRLLRWLLALGLLGVGVYLLLPGRNTFGNPAFEKELRRCTVPGTGVVFRLYEGNGGATTAFWYSVTHTDGWLSPERQVFYAYGEPEVKDIACQKDGVAMIFSDGAQDSQEKLALNKIREELRSRPLGLSMGARIEPRGSLLRRLSVGAGVLLATAGLLLGIMSTYRRSRNSL